DPRPWFAHAHLFPGPWLRRRLETLFQQKLEVVPKAPTCYSTSTRSNPACHPADEAHSMLSALRVGLGRQSARVPGKQRMRSLREQVVGNSWVSLLSAKSPKI